MLYQQVIYFETSSSASLTSSALDASFNVDLIETMFSQIEMFFIPSNSAFIFFAAVAAHVPFSIKPTVRFPFRKFLIQILHLDASQSENQERSFYK